MEEEQPLLQEKKKPSPYAVCIPILVFVLNAGMVMAVQQQWMLLYLCSRFKGQEIPKYFPGLFDNNPIVYPNPVYDVCRSEPDIQAMASKWSMIVSLCNGIPSLVLGTVYGILSDRIGRKPLLLLPMISAFLAFITYLSINYFQMGLWLLMMTSIVGGFLGSYTVLLTATLSFFADTSDESERGRVFVFGESVFFLGFALGPLIGGIIARNMTSDVVFSICAVNTVLIFIGTVFYLPESLQKCGSSERQQSLSIKQSVLDVADVFRKAVSPTFMCLIFGLCSVAAALTGRTLFFYYVSYKFGWDAQDEGQFILFSCGSRLVHMLVTFPLLSHFSKCETPHEKAKFDLWIIRTSLFVTSACSVLSALAPAGWMLYVISSVDAYGTLANPTLRSVLSRAVPASQGLLFSGIAVTEHLLQLIFGVIFPNIWSLTIRTRPNFFLYVIACLLFAGGCFLMVPKPEEVMGGKSEDEEEVLDEEREE